MGFHNRLALEIDCSINTMQFLIKKRNHKFFKKLGSKSMS